ncbi:GNAT family N-acetyltransferase [Streptomyces sp. 1222.5]|uniref:GNAT family N-acetyltransferase n=1 Tax=Streptomyces sp. 1222.5 TaxID=1881026 RepID=UPI003D7029DD
MAFSTPELRTARLRLRPFADADAAPLYALHSSAHVLRYWDSPPWTETTRAQRFIATCRTIEEEGTGARMAVDRVRDGAFIGWCGLSNWNPDFRSASLGYVFDATAWGQGYATETAHAVLRWAFDTLDLNRVQAETDTRNVASAALGSAAPTEATVDRSGVVEGPAEAHRTAPRTPQSHRGRRAGRLRLR